MPRFLLLCWAFTALYVQGFSTKKPVYVSCATGCDLASTISSHSLSDNVVILIGINCLVQQTITVSNTLTLWGATNSRAPPVISGSRQNRLFQIAPGGSLIIRNLTVEYGFANDLLGGGAVYANSLSTFACQNSIFRYNEVLAGDGGAVLASGQSNVYISGCSFANNFAFNGDGGALSVQGFSSLFIAASDFSLNSALYSGGAISVSQNSTIEISQSRFANNEGRNGGGLSISDSNNGSIVHTSSFVQNFGAFGGAIYMTNSNLSIFASNFSLNVASDASSQGLYLGSYIIDDNTFVTLFDPVISDSNVNTFVNSLTSFNLSNTTNPTCSNKSFYLTCVCSKTVTYIGPSSCNKLWQPGPLSLVPIPNCVTNGGIASSGSLCAPTFNVTYEITTKKSITYYQNVHQCVNVNVTKQLPVLPEGGLPNPGNGGSNFWCPIVAQYTNQLQVQFLWGYCGLECGFIGYDQFSLPTPAPVNTFSSPSVSPTFLTYTAYYTGPSNSIIQVLFASSTNCGNDNAPCSDQILPCSKYFVNDNEWLCQWINPSTLNIHLPTTTTLVTSLVLNNTGNGIKLVGSAGVMNVINIISPNSVDTSTIPPVAKLVLPTNLLPCDQYVLDGTSSVAATPGGVTGVTWVVLWTEPTSLVAFQALTAKLAVCNVGMHLYCVLGTFNFNLRRIKFGLTISNAFEQTASIARTLEFKFIPEQTLVTLYLNNQLQRLPMYSSCSTQQNFVYTVNSITWNSVNPSTGIISSFTNLNTFIPLSMTQAWVSPQFITRIRASTKYVLATSNAVQYDYADALAATLAVRPSCSVVTNSTTPGGAVTLAGVVSYPSDFQTLSWTCYMEPANFSTSPSPCLHSSPSFDRKTFTINKVVLSYRYSVFFLVNDGLSNSCTALKVLANNISYPSANGTVVKISQSQNDVVRLSSTTQCVPANANATWALYDANYLTDTSSRLQKLSPSLILVAANSLNPFGNYVMRLTCQGKVFDSMVVMNTPPYGGNLVNQGSNNFLINFDDVVTLTTSGWVDDEGDLPFTFAFGYSKSSVMVNFPAIRFSTVSTFFPINSYQFSIKVYDSFGAGSYVVNVPLAQPVSSPLITASVLGFYSTYTRRWIDQLLYLDTTALREILSGIAPIQVLFSNGYLDEPNSVYMTISLIRIFYYRFQTLTNAVSQSSALYGLGVELALSPFQPLLRSINYCTFQPSRITQNLLPDFTNMSCNASSYLAIIVPVNITLPTIPPSTSPFQVAPTSTPSLSTAPSFSPVRPVPPNMAVTNAPAITNSPSATGAESNTTSVLIIVVAVVVVFVVLAFSLCFCFIYKRRIDQQSRMPPRKNTNPNQAPEQEPEEQEEPENGEEEHDEFPNWVTGNHSEISYISKAPSELDAKELLDLIFDSNASANPAPHRPNANRANRAESDTKSVDSFIAQQVDIV